MEHFSRLDVVQARHALGQGAVLLDVREDFEWAEGHVPDALHIPLRAACLLGCGRSPGTVRCW